jgi:hypothetical protein
MLLPRHRRPTRRPASPADPPSPTVAVVVVLPSQLLTIEVLPRPVESAQYLSIRYSERLAQTDIVGSVGSRGDSHDNAMDERFNSLFKWELIYPRIPGPLRYRMAQPFVTGA